MEGVAVTCGAMDPFLWHVNAASPASTYIQALIKAITYYHHLVSLISTSSTMELSTDPFIAVDGIFNFRDIGGYPSSKDPTLSMRRGYIYRCANPGNVTSSGSQTIRDLGITKIFDLRSRAEIERTVGYGPVVDIAGVDRVSVPVYIESKYPSHQNVKNMENYFHRPVRIRCLRSSQ